jgi:glycosyltransferase involved in cell wall biosynthesis
VSTILEKPTLMSEGKSPKVTISLCVYNGEQFLRESIDSILSQTYSDFELLIYDDASTDHSVSLVESYQDERIRLIKGTQNRGLAFARQSCLELARGIYFALQDDDDISLPTRLEEQVAFLDKHPDIGMVGSWLQTIDETGRKTNSPFYNQRNQGHPLWWKWLFLTYCPISTSTVFRTELAKAVGGFAVDGQYDYRFGEDYVLYGRLNLMTGMTLIPKVLLYYRRHAKTLVNQTHKHTQAKQVLSVSHQTLQAYLGVSISVEAVQLLRLAWPPQKARSILPQSLEYPAYREAILLYFTLYRQFCHDHALPSGVKYAIQKDLIHHLLRLLTRLKTTTMLGFIRDQAQNFPVFLWFSPHRLLFAYLNSKWRAFRA